MGLSPQDEPCVGKVHLDTNKDAPLIEMFETQGASTQQKKY